MDSNEIEVLYALLKTGHKMNVQLCVCWCVCVCECVCLLFGKCVLLLDVFVV